MFHVKQFGKKFKIQNKMGCKMDKIIKIDIDKIQNELCLHFGDKNYLMVFDEYHKQFKNKNLKWFKIPCKIKWGVHEFKNLGEFFSEITLSFYFCDGFELQCHYEHYNKIMIMYNNGLINDNDIILLL